MTVSTSTTRELDIERLCLLAYRQATLLELSQAMTNPQASYARDLLETIIDQLQARGVYARAQSFYTLTLVAGTATYSLPANALDVLGDGKYITEDDNPAAPQSETTVRQISAKQWQQDLGTRSSDGPPSMFYVHRESALLEVRIWPIPDDDGAIRFRIHRLLADNDDGTRTIDLERPWAKYIIYELAYHLAIGQSIPQELRRELKLNAEAMFKECKGFSTSHVGGDMVIDHPTGW